MATLIELKTIEATAMADLQSAEAQLRNRVEVALWKIAQGYIAGTSLPADPQEKNEAIGWAQSTLRSPGGVVGPVFRAILAANSGASVSTIMAVSDTAIETAVATLVKMFARGLHPGT